MNVGVVDQFDDLEKIAGIKGINDDELDASMKQDTTKKFKNLDKENQW
jgi:hypothetical protein